MAGLLDKAKTASNDEPKSSKKSAPKAESATLLSKSKPVVAKIGRNLKMVDQTFR